jgi:hypothetical protein
MSDAKSLPCKLAAAIPTGELSSLIQKFMRQSVSLISGRTRSSFSDGFALHDHIMEVGVVEFVAIGCKKN